MRSQLTSAEITNISGTWSAVYNYHKNGNMDDKTVNSTQTTYEYDWQSPAGDDCHLMTKLTEGSTPITLDYDENGNLVSSSHESQATSHEYNWDNKLRSATKGATEIALRYDPTGNRIRKVIDDGSGPATERKYIVDIVGDLPVILMDLEKLGVNYSIKKIYIYANSQIIAQHDGDTSDDLYFYLHDRLGSVRQIINTTNGDVVKLYTYNPFGETLEEEGTLNNPFMFVGQFYDSEINEYYLRARMYDPYISRFTARDPVSGQFEEPLTLHKYLYCINDPINMIDPEGLWYKEVHRRFGDYGWGWEPERGFALFDYGRMDDDFPPTDFDYTDWHFRSREEILPDLIAAAAAGNKLEFAYFMHEWQDSYVHYDRLSGPPWGPRWHALAKLMGTEIDDPKDKGNLEVYAWARCEITTLILEHFWFQNNPFSAGVEVWLEQLEKTGNPWLISDLRYVEISTTTGGLIYEGPLTGF